MNKQAPDLEAVIERQCFKLAERRHLRQGLVPADRPRRGGLQVDENRG